MISGLTSESKGGRSPPKKSQKVIPCVVMCWNMHLEYARARKQLSNLSLILALEISNKESHL